MRNPCWWLGADHTFVLDAFCFWFPRKCVGLCSSWLIIFTSSVITIIHIGTLNPYLHVKLCAPITDLIFHCHIFSNVSWAITYRERLDRCCAVTFFYDESSSVPLPTMVSRNNIFNIIGIRHITPPLSQACATFCFTCAILWRSNERQLQNLFGCHNRSQGWCASCSTVPKSYYCFPKKMFGTY